MREENAYAAYIMASFSGTLYAGVTNDLLRRVFEHKHGIGGAFTSKYRCVKLVYWEEFDDPSDAIAREKEIKGWLRSKKEALIRSKNPAWFDLARDWEDPFQDADKEELRRIYRRLFTQWRDVIDQSS